MTRQVLLHQARRLGNGMRSLTFTSTPSSRRGEELFASGMSEWWDDKHGDFAELHALNPARCQFVKDIAERHLRTGRGLHGRNVIDIGCGGGILTESLARLGASNVLGIDEEGRAIEAAKEHANTDPTIAERVRYEEATPREIAERGDTFDLVVASEVIEHVDCPELFLQDVGRLCKPGSAVILTTINRTLASYFFAIVFAERVAGLIPPGTHEVWFLASLSLGILPLPPCHTCLGTPQWRKFLRPSEVTALCNRAGIDVTDLCGMRPEIALSKRTWRLTPSTEVNYLLAGINRGGGSDS